MLIIINITCGLHTHTEIFFFFKYMICLSIISAIKASPLFFMRSSALQRQVRLVIFNSHTVTQADSFVQALLH